MNKEDMVEGICEYPDCNEPAEGIARAKLLCKKHFKIIKKRNISLFNKNKDIPSELD